MPLTIPPIRFGTIYRLTPETEADNERLSKELALQPEDMYTFLSRIVNEVDADRHQFSRIPPAIIGDDQFMYAVTGEDALLLRNRTKIFCPSQDPAEQGALLEAEDHAFLAENQARIDKSLLFTYENDELAFGLRTLH